MTTIIINAKNRTIELTKTFAKNACISSIENPQKQRENSSTSAAEFRTISKETWKAHKSTGNFASCVGMEPLPV